MVGGVSTFLPARGGLKVNPYIVGGLSAIGVSTPLLTGGGLKDMTKFAKAKALEEKGGLKGALRSGLFRLSNYKVNRVELS